MGIFKFSLDKLAFIVYTNASNYFVFKGLYQSVNKNILKYNNNWSRIQKSILMPILYIWCIILDNHNCGQAAMEFSNMMTVTDMVKIMQNKKNN